MPTSTQSSDSSQPPNETALILEHVEMLLAFHENQDGHTPNDFRLLLDVKTDQIVSAVEYQIEKRFEKLESQIEQLFEDLGSRVSSSGPPTNGQQEIDSVSQPPTPDPDHNASHWQVQKEAMLLKYGIDSDHRPSTKLVESLKPAATPGPEELKQELKTDTETEFIPAKTHESIPVADAASIQKLKDALNEKLRVAEVELSIGRAKISQQQALLAEERVELDRRTEMIKEKYASVSQSLKREIGFFQRLWIHVKPKHPEVNDRA